jgi:diguanylate cyclase (GGDEF)-like protein/PAS domain S-box-containing protein
MEACSEQVEGGCGLKEGRTRLSETRSELMEAALDAFCEGVALLDLEERVVFWNRAAERITGYSGADLLGRLLPEGLEPLAQCRNGETRLEPRSGPQRGRGLLVHTRHKSGHDVTAIAFHMILRNDLGGHLGTAAIFHPGERLNALPHGETSDGTEVQQSQAELQDRLAIEFDAFVVDGVPLNVLWISVDQACDLRRTHGARACETMLEGIERVLANGLRPGEEVGRWGDDEFLIISHADCSPEALASHARLLAGLARTADFRWWGDRVSLTVSIGAAIADKCEKLAELLERAQTAMLTSTHAGGNTINVAPGRQTCSPS